MMAGGMVGLLKGDGLCVGSIHGQPVLADDVAHMQDLSAGGILVHLGDTSPAHLLAQFFDGRGKEGASRSSSFPFVLFYVFVCYAAS